LQPSLQLLEIVPYREAEEVVLTCQSLVLRTMDFQRFALAHDIYTKEDVMNLSKFILENMEVILQE